jgi:hypothetical protein
MHNTYCLSTVKQVRRTPRNVTLYVHRLTAVEGRSTDRVQRQKDCKYTVVGTERRGMLEIVRSYRQMELKNENFHIKEDGRRET